MKAEELNAMLTSASIERKIRELAVTEKLASAEEIAVMSNIEVCELIAKEYVFLYKQHDRFCIVWTGYLPQLEQLIVQIKK